MPTGPGTAAPYPHTDTASFVSSFARAVVAAENEGVRSEREHGDRHHFLADARKRLEQPGPPTPVRLRPALPVPAMAPDPGDGRDGLINAFVDALEKAGGTCHVVDETIPDTLLDHLIAEFEAWDVVVSAEPEAQAIGERFERRGVDVKAATIEASATAALGVTSARAGIAATGTVVLDSSHTAGRSVSALPTVHLCVLPAERLVASPSDVLRPLGEDGAIAPSLVLVTGPSRSGDIDQVLTIGAHGPSRLHVIVVGPG